MNVIQNTTASIPFACTVDGAAFDLSGATEIEISLKQDVPELVLTKLLSTSGVTISGDGNNIAIGIFSPSETLQFVPGFGKAQIRVKSGDVVLGDVAEVVRIAAANSTEVL